jgi:nuclear GTP-binding protein
MIDTPGLAWSAPAVEGLQDEVPADAARARDILMRNRGRIDRLKDPMAASSCPISSFLTRSI